MKLHAFMIICLLAASAVQAQTGGFGGGSGGTAPGGGAAGGAAAGRPGAQAQRAPTETVGVVEIAERVYNTTVSGRIRPANTVNHPATVTGIVSAVHAVVGQSVRAGEALFSIDRDEVAGAYAPVIIRARMGGVVSAVNVRRDNEVRSGENGVSVIDNSEYLLTTQVSDKDAFNVPVGRSVTAVLGSGATTGGVLLGRSPEPDYQTGLFDLTFRFGGGPSVFPGAFVTVDLPVETVRGLFIPQNLLVRRYGRFYVWSVTEENTLRMQEVTTGRTHEDEIQITAGLRPGDRILLQRRGNEREGMPVPGTE